MLINDIQILLVKYIDLNGIYLLTVMSGGLSLGTLTEDDLTSDYGSAATANYKPFIADPETTMYQTSRLLRNR